LSGEFDSSDLRSRLHAYDPFAERVITKAPEAAVSIILNPFLTNESLLLIARTRREGDVWSGQVAFPGGRKAVNDDNLCQTALRETREEVGVSLSDHDLLGALPAVYTRTNGIGVLPFVFRLKTAVRLAPNYEVADSFWVPLHYFRDTQPVQAAVDLEGGHVLAECYMCEGRVIWGLTFRIINQLIGRRTNSTDWRRLP